jgi:high affinity Mn2+ porin
MDDGAWDYPADTRGYTLGGTIELNQPRWALRYGVFAMPKVANGSDLDSKIPKSLGQALELEERWSLGDRSGTVRFLGYRNGAHMGTYRQAIEHPGLQGPDVTLTRAYTVKYGFGVQIEQQLTDTLGLFGHAGWNDGRTESFAFTEVDRTAALGLSFKGTRWHRPEDVLGIAAVGNGLSNDHRDYLAAGGYGFIIGDGRLRYGYEEIAEAYYLIKLVDHVSITADFQFVEHPAYNRDRGPVTITGLRVHLEF